jgi:[protein-PII] uridylyltransferase
MLTLSTRHVAPKEIKELLKSKRDLDLVFCKDYLARAREWLARRLEQGAWARELVTGYSQLVDLLVAKIFATAKAESDEKFPAGERALVLVALGGYGRSELSLYSDVDLTLVYRGDMDAYVQTMSERLFYLLWDMGFDLNFSTRTVPDCIKAIKENFATRTAFIDIRFVCGDEPFYARVQEEVYERTLYKMGKALVDEKLEVAKKRHERYGGSVHLLEPNIMQSKGGLRDIHSALWICKIKFKSETFLEAMKKGVIGKRDLRTLSASYEFLLRVRNHLHNLNGRKEDRLTFDYQEEIAKLFGYQKLHRSLPVEQLMRSYYRHANNVSRFLEKLVEQTRAYLTPASKGFTRLALRDIADGFRIYKGELLPASLRIFDEDPVRLMRSFKYSRDHKVQLAPSLKELIREKAKLIDDGFRRAEEVNQIFLEILCSGMESYSLLKGMHDLKLLGRFIPEFGKVECQVQYDLYHVFTVDIHLLFTVKELAAYLNAEDSAEAGLPILLGREIRHPRLLLLAGLFHDIGKGAGSNHCHKGALMVKKIARRMGLKDWEADLLAFLVENHLLISTLAQRRDLSDEKLIADFVRKVQNEQTLKMLYLLSIADLKSVGPDVLTDWKGRLFKELYLKAADAVERGDFKGELVQEKIERIMSEVERLLQEEIALEEIQRELRQMPPRYLLAYHPVEIAGHVRMRRRLKDELFVTEVEHSQDKSFSIFAICTLDHVGLFAQISGIMAANGVNILAAQINTATDGIALDRFLLNDSQGRAVMDEDKWSQIRAQLKLVMAGQADVDDLVSRGSAASSLLQHKVPRFPPRVFIDNQVSDNYTVIDVFAHDRLGLLYDIARTLADLNLTVDFSKVSTKVDQAADVFYVREKKGGKVMDPARLKYISSALLKVTE